jgi:hypothetical protein
MRTGHRGVFDDGNGGRLRAHGDVVEGAPAAFRIAVSLTMLLTMILIFLTMREVWGWSRFT